MKLKKQVILKTNPCDDLSYKVSLTKKQIKLLKWLSKHGFLLDDVTFITMEEKEFLPID